MTITRNANEGESELWQQSACALRNGLLNGSFSAVDIVKACLARIGDVNPYLNAVVEIEQQAVALARAVDRRIKANHESVPSLAGIPVLTKINTRQQGYATSQGSVALKDIIAIKDDPIIAKLRKAGAILLGRTNCAALAFRYCTNNDLYGKTLNPWNGAVTPGGSSGGASSAVASGMAPIAQATDIGGSIRFPAYACGLVGLKPTTGLIARWDGDDTHDAGLMFQLFNSHGYITRTVDDARLALQSTAGYDPGDPYSVPYSGCNEKGADKVKKKSVTIVREVKGIKTHPHVEEALDEAAKAFVDAGYEVVEESGAIFKEAYTLWTLLCMPEVEMNMDFIRSAADYRVLKAIDGYHSIFERLWGNDIRVETYIKGYERRGTLMRNLQLHLEKRECVLTPVIAQPTFTYDLDIENQAGMDNVFEAFWPMLALNVLGFPGVAVPCIVKDGLPIGVQIVGGRLQEEELLDMAKIIEEKCTFRTPIEPIRVIDSAA